MARERVIVEFQTPEEAKKVEETVKTGYAETAIENVIHWIAVEQDLVSTYGRLAEMPGSSGRQSVFRQLRDESAANVGRLNDLLKALEGLDRARVGRIDLLANLAS